MDLQTFKNGNSMYPVSTETFDLIQQQILLLQKLTNAVGDNVIILNATAQQDGLVIINSELLPLKTGLGGDYIKIEETEVTVSAQGINFSRARVIRYAQYCADSVNGLPVASFRQSQSILQLMTRVAHIEQDYMPRQDINNLVTELARQAVPKGTIIDWSGNCTVSSIPYGFVPCGNIGIGKTAASLNIEKSEWETRYDNITIQVINNGTVNPRLRITQCNGVTVPDLTDRFIVQAGGAYSCGNTGGSNSVTLTINQIPKHRHVVSADERPAADTTYFGMGEEGNAPASGSTGVGDGKRIYTSYAGGPYGENGTVQNESQNATSWHENRPPFYALVKLIKVI